MPSTWRSAEALVPRAGSKRVLVLGCSPLPFENERMNYAPGARTWQFAGALAQEGHGVCAACSRIPGAYGESTDEIRELAHEGVLTYTMSREAFDGPETLAGLVAAFSPDVVVAASALPSRRAVLLAGDRPVWVDLFGDPMAEAQAKAAVDGRDDMMAYFYLMWPLLERGDAFSAVSERQRYAVIGQLGLFGRLNRATCGLELVHTVPCAAPPASGEIVGREAAAPEDVAEGDFVVLWSGGFNTWCDVDTLFGALERAIAENPSIRFVSTGAEIKGHDERTYGRFVELVEASEHRERFLLKGLLPAAQAQRYLARADLGVVTEKAIYERTLGSSGRMVDWLARGLPFVCAEVSELAAAIAANELSLTYPPGDSETLARRILDAAADPGELRRLGERARRYAGREWTPAASTRALRDWVARAARLPDTGEPQIKPFMETHCAGLEARVRAETEARIRAETEARIRDLEQRLGRREEDYQGVRGELGRIHHSKAWRWWMRYLAFRRALLGPFDRLRKKA